MILLLQYARSFDRSDHVHDGQVRYSQDYLAGAVGTKFRVWGGGGWGVRKEASRMSPSPIKIMPRDGCVMEQSMLAEVFIASRPATTHT